jgi:hypothetical protein
MIKYNLVIYERFPLEHGEMGGPPYRDDKITELDADLKFFKLLRKLLSDEPTIKRTYIRGMPPPHQEEIIIEMNVKSEGELDVLCTKLRENMEKNHFMTHVYKQTLHPLSIRAQIKNIKAHKAFNDCLEGLYPGREIVYMPLGGFDPDHDYMGYCEDVTKNTERRFFERGTGQVIVVTKSRIYKFRPLECPINHKAITHPEKCLSSGCAHYDMAFAERWFAKDYKPDTSLDLEDDLGTRDIHIERIPVITSAKHSS